jgi:hypothetical protein
MKRILLFAIVSMLGGCAGTNLSGGGPVSTIVERSATSGTHVHELLPFGGESLDAGGMDAIGAKVAKIQGVTRVDVFEYYQTQDVANEIMATPSGVRQVIVGFSCGANAAPVVAAAIQRPIAGVFVIQPSTWCGGGPVSANVQRAQETYNPACGETFGLGCKLLDLAPGFNPSNFTVIQRPDCHICSDRDPDAVNDIVLAVRSVTTPRAGLRFGARVPGAINVLVRHHGQTPY